MRYIHLLEEFAGGAALDGWWIDEFGGVHECDHRKGIHHADIAIAELNLADHLEPEDSEDDDWFRDSAITIALDDGWVRASAYDGVLSIYWKIPMTRASRGAVLKWLEVYGPSFKQFVIHPPNDATATIFEDSRKAARFVYTSTKSVTEDLTERSALDHNVNSLGKPISGNPEAFWAWFGNSKVKDKQGRPLVVFHGTDSDFSKFDPDLSNANANTGVPRGSFVFSDHSGVASSYSAVEYGVNGWRDPKITAAFRELLKTGSFDDQMQFLADHPSGYDEFKDGGNVMPVYLRINRPLVVDAKSDHWHDIYFKPKGYDSPESFTTNEIASYAKENGYDGVIIKNVKDVHKGPTHIATTFFVFSPSQIKSAISGTGYKQDSDDIQEDKDTLELPDIEVGDEVLVGKFKNRKATVKGFKTDDNNQPVLKTDKGDQKLFKPRIKKLMDEERLEEGLIAIPPKMLEEIEFYLTFNMLWRMRDEFAGKTKKLAEVYDGFKQELIKFGEKLPDERFPKDKEIQVWSIKVSADGLPKSYAHLKPRVDRIRFAIDWRPNKTHGGWRPDKDALIIYPMSLDYMRWYPSERSHPDDLRIALATLRETISHELRHMVQFVFLHDYPDQTKQKADYANHGKDYFTSPVEFDPSIGSAVQEFMEFWIEHGQKKMPLSKAVKQYVGAMPTNAFDLFKPPELFRHLKVSAPARYKTAVSKFLTELQARIREYSSR